ncbi:hypothetical protein ABPG75_008845 [Micractinium tetrahymenae]
MAGSILELAWRRYLQQLEKRPLKTKAVTAGVLAGVSDLLAQRLSGSTGAGINWRRTLAIALYGVVWSGPAGHFWQQILERLFPDQKDPLRSVKKVVVDQLTFGPLCNGLFLAFMAGVVEGRGWAGTRDKLRREFAGVQQRGWRLWPLASFISQQFVPLQLRVLWLNAVAFLWSLFLIMRSSAGARGAAALAAARSATLHKA